MKIDLASHLSTATLRVKTVPVCLDGELMSALWDAEDAVEAFTPPSVQDQRLVTVDPAKELHEQVQAARAAVAEKSLPFKVQALPSEEWDILISEHPPRKDAAGKVVEADQLVGYDFDGFRKALLRRCLVDPECTDAQYAQLLGALDPAQYEQLENAAFTVNRKRQQIPFSPAGSSRAGSSVTTSRPQ